MLSRVADSLYWMSRYIERAEHTARLIAVKLDSMVEQTPEDAAASWARVIESLTGDKTPPQSLDAFAITKRLAFDRDNNTSMVTSLALARDNARQVREALGKGETCRVLLRNYRKDGTVFWNELTVLPLLDGEGRVTHFAGHHRDAGERLRIDPKLTRDSLSGAHQPTSVAIRDDRLTGLFTLAYLEELLKRDWAVAQREKRSIAVFAIDIDALDLYNTTFGRAAGDSTIRRVAHVVSGCLRRSSDVTARIEKLEQEVKDPKPGARNKQLSVEVQLTVFGTTIPDAKLAFSGDGQSSSEAEVSDRNLAADTHEATKDVIKDAIKQAVDQAVLKLSIGKSGPLNEGHRHKK